MSPSPTDSLRADAGPREGAGKRALVTGMRGFTGRYLARELAAAGYRVFGTALPGEAGGQPGGRSGAQSGAESGAQSRIQSGARFGAGADAGLDAEMLALDLCDRQAVAALVEQVRPDVVVHLAAIAFVGHSDAAQIYHVNVVGTRNLLEALAGARHPVASVLLASSANIYGNARVPLIDETVVPAPANDYAVSKLAMEYMARLWMDKLPIIITRPFNYTGPGQSENFLLPKIIGHLRRREPCIELGNLAIARDFSDVRMVAASYRRLLAAAPVGDTFNVCSGRSHSLAEVLDMACEIAGYRIEVRVNPAFVRANDVLTLTGSNARLTAVIGPVASPPLFDTLRWMYQS